MKNIYSFSEVRSIMNNILDKLEYNVTKSNYNDWDWEVLNSLDSFISEFSGDVVNFTFLEIFDSIKMYNESTKSTYDPHDVEEQQIRDEELSDIKNKLLKLAQGYIQETGANNYSPEELVNYWLIKGSV